MDENKDISSSGQMEDLSKYLLFPYLIITFLHSFRGAISRQEEKIQAGESA